MDAFCQPSYPQNPSLRPSEAHKLRNAHGSQGHTLQNIFGSFFHRHQGRQHLLAIAEQTTR